MRLFAFGLHRLAAHIGAHARLCDNAMGSVARGGHIETVDNDEIAGFSLDADSVQTGCRHIIAQQLDIAGLRVRLNAGGAVSVCRDGLAFKRDGARLGGGVNANGVGAGGCHIAAEDLRQTAGESALIAGDNAPGTDAGRFNIAADNQDFALIGEGLRENAV